MNSQKEWCSPKSESGSAEESSSDYTSESDSENNLDPLPPKVCLEYIV